jgi:hypothetical protein
LLSKLLTKLGYVSISELKYLKHKHNQEMKSMRKLEKRRLEEIRLLKEKLDRIGVV